MRPLDPGAMKVGPAMVFPFAARMVMVFPVVAMVLPVGVAVMVLALPFGVMLLAFPLPFFVLMLPVAL